MWSPNYYNTFVQPMQPIPQQQFAPAGGGQTVTGTLNGTGPSGGSSHGYYMPGEPGYYNNQGGMFNQQGQQNQQFGDQGSGKMGYGSQQNPYSAQRNLQNRQQLDQVVLNVANQGLSGQAGIDAINKQMGYDTGAVWDTQRGNYDIGTGGSNGVQYDRSGGGQYGAHDYNDAGAPAQSGGMQGTMPSWGNQQQNDPMAWRRQNYMRQHQQPTYGGGFIPTPGWGTNQPQSMPNQSDINGPGGIYSNYGSLNGTAPSSYNNSFGAPTNHPMNQKLMY